MRATIASCLVLVSLGLTPLAQALNFKDGRVVQGGYSASGSTSFANVKVRYGESNARVSYFGQIRGKIRKVVVVKGKRLISTVNLRGTVRKIRRKGASFSAPTIIRLSDGVVVRGKFRGLVGSDRLLSRYFSGHISGVSNGRFLLRHL